MKKQVLQFAVVLAVLITSNSWAGGVADDFEDGNWTSNPTWTINENQYGSEIGYGEITTDPVRSGNTTVRGMGTNTGHRRWRLSVDAIPWTAFDIRTEFLATAWNFGFYIGVGNDDYEVNINAWYDPTKNPTYVKLGIADLLTPTIFPKEYFTLNKWYELHAWYDSDLGMLVAEFAALDGSSSWTNTKVPTEDLTQLDPISWTEFGIEETNWQYADNFTLTGPTCTAPIKGDMNNDCKIDFKDLADILSRWLECNLEPEELCWQ